MVCGKSQKGMHAIIYVVPGVKDGNESCWNEILPDHAACRSYIASLLKIYSGKYHDHTMNVLNRKKGSGSQTSNARLLSGPGWLQRRMNWSATSANWWNRRWAASLASWRLAELRMLAAASCRAYTVLLLTDASAHRVCNIMRASGL